MAIINDPSIICVVGTQVRLVDEDLYDTLKQELRPEMHKHLVISRSYSSKVGSPACFYVPSVLSLDGLSSLELLKSNNSVIRCGLWATG